MVSLTEKKTTRKKITKSGVAKKCKMCMKAQTVLVTEKNFLQVSNYLTHSPTKRSLLAAYQLSRYYFDH